MQTPGGAWAHNGKVAQASGYSQLAPLSVKANERTQSVAVDVEVEVLVLHFLVLAVGADGQDGSADLVSQGLIALAHGNTGAHADVFLIGVVRAYQGEAFTGVGLDKAIVDIDDVSKGGVQTTGSQIEKGFVLRAVTHDLDTGRGKDIGGVTVVGGCALYADFLAFQINQRVVEYSTRFHRQLARGLVVLAAEINRFQAIFGDAHRRQYGVELTHFQGRDQAVEFLLDPFAFHFHLFAQGDADVVVETADGTFRGFESERRVSRFDTDTQRLSLFSHGQRRQHGQRQCAEKCNLLHFVTPSNGNGIGWQRLFGYASSFA